YHALQAAPASQKRNRRRDADGEFRQVLVQVVHAGRRPVAQRENDVLFEHARLVGRPALFDGDDFHAARLVQVVLPGQVPGDRHAAAVQAEVAADDAAVLDELRQQVLGRVDRDREADALGGQDDGRVDADHLAPAVHERAAAVAGVEGGVRLNHIVHEVAGAAAQ